MGAASNPWQTNVTTPNFLMNPSLNISSIPNVSFLTNSSCGIPTIAPSCLANSSVINMPIAQMSTPMTPSVPNLNSLSNLMLKQQPGSNHFVSIPNTNSNPMQNMNANQFQHTMPSQQMTQNMGVQVVQ